jgi:type VI secretion system secreted protein VgrG
MRTATHRPNPSNLFRRFVNPKTLALVALGTVTLLGLTSYPASAATTINLGSATPYAVVAGTTITNTGSSVISGDIGLSPGTSITGFPPGTISGTTDAADAPALAAQTSSTAAYGVAASSTPFTTVAGGTLGGTLAPGVYQSASALALNGSVTLNGGGNPDAVFIFQAGSTLTTASGSAVVLENGAQACNVFWQVGSSATLGTGTSFSGTILALASVTADTGASVQGRLLAQTGAVTLDDNTVTVPVCALAVTTTTTTTTTTAPTTTTTLHKTPTTTTTKPVAAHPSGSSGSGSSSGTIIPVGAPATGDGGMAGSSFSPAGLIGLIALAISASAVSIAVRIRRRQ